MKVFLTSSPTGSLDGLRKVDGLDAANAFVTNLRKYWKKEARVLMITASPEAYEENDKMVAFFKNAVKLSGFTWSVFDLWDDRTRDFSGEVLLSYDVIFLGGGHVPTQNAFFHKINLREKIAAFQGIVIGISAGTMNSADIVYAQPELEGESIDPSYQRFLTGLNLTKTQILPHYQTVKDYLLDGKRLYEDITFADSYDHSFLVLPDGSYFMNIDGEESVMGEAYILQDGILYQISSGDN